MSISIPLTGTFGLTIKLRRVGTAGEAIAGVSFYDDVWHDCLWIRLMNPIVGTTYQLNMTGLQLNDISDVNPNINFAGVYGGLGAAWGSFSGSPVIWNSGVFGDGTGYVIYLAGTGVLETRGNEIDKPGELNVTSGIGSEIVDWYLS
jgi:hypothetical protein